MAPRKCKAKEMAATTSAMPGRVTRSLVTSSGSKFVKLPDPRKSQSMKKMEEKAEMKGKGKEGSAAKGEKAEEENSKNVQEGFVAEGEISNKVPEGSAVEGEKEEEENSKNVQEGSVVEGEISDTV